MRNKDGVSKTAGQALLKLLGLGTGILAAGAAWSGRPSWGRSHVPALDDIQRALNKAGYSAYEYLGYVMFFHSTKEGSSSEAKLIQISRLISENVFRDFLAFKRSRLSRLTYLWQSILTNYKSKVNYDLYGPEHILSKIIVANEVFKLEILFMHRESFSVEFMEKYIKFAAGIVGEKLKVSPELLVVCPCLTRELRANGGDNEFARLTLAT
jgi:hypothetical protein